MKRCDSFGKNYGKKLRKLNAKIDRKIARYNSDAVKKSIGKNGVMDKGDFWKLEKRLLPKAHNVPHALQDQSGFEVTDPINIKSEYKAEFEHRLGKREPKKYLEGYMNSQNKVCSLRLEVSKGKLDDEFNLEEVERAISELKRGKCSDPTGLIRKVFIRSGKCMILSILRVMNLIKQHQVLPFEWSNIWIRPLKKNKGSIKVLNYYRGIFIVDIMSIIFEKLLKYRLMPHLQQNMTKFQTGGVKGKDVTDNLFLMRGVIDWAKYLKQKVWFTFYDIEKCFDSLWLGDCLNSLWKNGVQNDIFYLIYLINKRSDITVKTPFGDTYPFFAEEIVKQGTVLGPILNNCSLDDVCKEGKGYQYGSIELKPFEFVDDIADPNRSKYDAQISSKVITRIQEFKKLKFSSEKCKVLKINSSSNTDTLFIEDRALDIENSTSYLGDVVNDKGDNTALCKDRTDKAVGTIIELFSICKEVNFGKFKISNLLTLYQSAVIPRLIYNCEAWSNLKAKDYQVLQKLQLNFLKRVTDVPRTTPNAALFLELGVWPVQYIIEQRQLLHLKRILDRDNRDPVWLPYKEMLKYEFEPNWANNILGLREKYNLPLKDLNIQKLSKPQWKTMLKRQVRKFVFHTLCSECSQLKRYTKLEQPTYLTELDPKYAQMIFKAKLEMFDIKVNFKGLYSSNLQCLFCYVVNEEFSHMFNCEFGPVCPASIRGLTLRHLHNITDLQRLKCVGKFLMKYERMRSFLI